MKISGLVGQGKRALLFDSVAGNHHEWSSYEANSIIIILNPVEQLAFSLVTIADD